MLKTLPQITKKYLLCSLLTLITAISFSSYASSSEDELSDWQIRDVTWRFDVGASLLKLKVIDDFSAPPPEYGDTELSPLMGLALLKRTGERSIIGTKVEFQRINGALLTAFRAIDYRYILNSQWQLGAFIGAAKYDFRSPAYGYTAGFGGFYRPPHWKKWSIGMEVQFMDKLARDKIHPDDKPSTPATGPDTFTNMAGVSLTFSRYF